MSVVLAKSKNVCTFASHFRRDGEQCLGGHPLNGLRCESMQVAANVRVISCWPLLFYVYKCEIYKCIISINQNVMKVKVANLPGMGYVMVDLSQVSAFCQEFVEFHRLHGLENGGADFVPVCSVSLIHALGSVDWSSLYKELKRNEKWFDDALVERFKGKEVCHE